MPIANRTAVLAGVIALLLLAPLADASDRRARYAATATHPDVVHDAGYLAAHPDQGWRAMAVVALDRDRLDDAITYLRRAARHADKPSQAMLATLLWEGRGTLVPDRPAAYAWMDLAAERGYPDFLATRELFWAELDEAERARALELGAPLHAEYADYVAQPRLDAELRRARSRMTGSRVGFIGAMTVIPTRSRGYTTLSGDTFYDARHWDPKRYWQTQDALWNALPQGHAVVGELRRDETPVEP